MLVTAGVEPPKPSISSPTQPRTKFQSEIRFQSQNSCPRPTPFQPSPAQPSPAPAEPPKPSVSSLTQVPVTKPKFKSISSQQKQKIRFPQPPAPSPQPALTAPASPSPQYQPLLSNEAPPPLTQIRNVVSKEETCPKRFSQKDSLKKILSKISLFCQTRPRPPSPKFEMWFQKRKPAQNVSLKKILSKRFSQKFLSSVKRGPAPPHPNSKCGFKRGNLPKTILSKDSLKKNLSKLVGTQTLNNFYKP